MPTAQEAQQIKEEAEWKAQQDAKTLAETNIILNDSKRFNAARKAAKKLAKDAKEQFEGLMKVAGRTNKVEGMKVLRDDTGS